MDLKARHGPTTGLDEDELRATEKLLETCNRHEGLDLPVALRSEPVSRAAFVLSKVLALGSGMIATALTVQALGAYAIITVVEGPPPVAPYLATRAGAGPDRVPGRCLCIRTRRVITWKLST